MILFEELESRTLMSVAVSSIQLTADENAIVAAKTSYNNAILALGDTLVSRSQTLETELPSSKTNHALGKKAISALTKVLSTIQKETGTLEKDTLSLSAKAVVAGNADIATPSTKTDANVQKAGLKLLSKVDADQAKITNDKSLLNFYVALNTLITANPSATQFSTDVHSLANAVPLSALASAETGLQTAILTLTGHLGVIGF